MADRNDQRQPAFDKIQEEPGSLLRELVQFLRQHKKLWMLPLIVLLMLLGLLIVLSGSAAAPFIYTLF